MAHIELQRVTFVYPNEDKPALTDLSIAFPRGEFVVLCGPSGSGKSTLLRLLKREVSPGGSISGSILLDELPLQDWPAREAASLVGLVMQNPDNQLVVDTVEHELAFAMENFGMERSMMRRRMAELAGFFGLEPLLDRKTDELSGGQKQMVNLAAVLMTQPRVLLLDEPMAQLDPLAARELLGMIKRLNEEWGITVIMSEHRVDDLLPLADRVVRLEGGRISYNGPARDFVLEAWRRQEETWLSALPALSRWALARAPLDSHPLFSEPPLTVKETRRWLELADRTLKPSNVSQSVSLKEKQSRQDKPLLAADGLFFAYDKHSPAILKGLDIQLQQGDWTVLFGGNGSGKSTLLQLLAGLRPAQRGQVAWQGIPYSRMSTKERLANMGYLAQNPVLHFAYDTLLEDLLQAARHAGWSEPEQGISDIAQQFGLTELLHRHPHDLSGGEQQLGALALILISKPRLLILDEPTKGLDPSAKHRLGEHLQQIHEQGTTLLMATHDVEFAAAYANRCALLFHGEIVAAEEPETFFQGNLFYATPLHRLYIEGGIPFS